MKTPVLDALKKLMEDKPTSFHVPGHKGRNSLIEWGKLIPQLDITELEGTDNLLDPRGIIKESQDLAAKAFGARASFYGVNGSTGSNYVAMAAITEPGDKVLIQRNSHKSIYNGLILNRLKPVYLYPNYNEKFHLLTGIDPKEVERKLKEDPDIKAVIITNPNYYGICSDIEEITRIVHKYGRLLMVDEAHGAHLVFSDKSAKSALEAGADLVIHSTHKTLPSFTQTSIIHVGSHRVDLNKLRDRYSLFTTTSPSYLFTLSNEIATAYMVGEGRERLAKTLDHIQDVIEELKQIPRVSVFTGDDEDKTIHDLDITKILFKIGGLTGSRVDRLLAEKYNIRLEMADYYYCLALSSLMNEKEDFEKLILAIKDIAKNEPYGDFNMVSVNMPNPKIRMDLVDAYYAKKEIIDLKDSIGRISGSFIIPYPPGIPLLAAGEEVTEELYEHIIFLRENNIEIVGLMGYNKDQIVVIE